MQRLLPPKALLVVLVLQVSFHRHSLVLAQHRQQHQKHMPTHHHQKQRTDQQETPTHQHEQRQQAHQHMHYQRTHHQQNKPPIHQLEQRQQEQLHHHQHTPVHQHEQRQQRTHHYYPHKHHPACPSSWYSKAQDEYFPYSYDSYYGISFQGCCCA